MHSYLPTTVTFEFPVKMRQKLLLLIICSLYGVTPHKLPGRQCPEVPPSHTDFEPDYSKCIIFSIPFTAAVPSHLFKDIGSKVNADECIQILMHNSSGEFEYMSLFLGRGYVRSEVVSSDNASYTLQSEVRKLDNSRQCNSPVLEEVHFWCEFPFCFFWSCVEGRKGGE